MFFLVLVNLCRIHPSVYVITLSYDLQTFEDIFKTLSILLINSKPEMPNSAVGSSAVLIVIDNPPPPPPPPPPPKVMGSNPSASVFCFF